MFINARFPPDSQSPINAHSQQYVIPSFPTPQNLSHSLVDPGAARTAIPAATAPPAESLAQPGVQEHNNPTEDEIDPYTGEVSRPTSESNDAPSNLIYEQRCTPGPEAPLVDHNAIFQSTSG